MSKTEEKKQIYEVWILRHDEQHICCSSEMNYDKCFENWEKLVRDWKVSLSEKSPFSMNTPVITAFDPGLIKEITLRPVIQIAESKYDNPYQKQMMRDGLTSTLKGVNNAVSDILDGGYK
jgi:hypothetical protein